MPNNQFADFTSALRTSRVRVTTAGIDEVLPEGGVLWCEREEGGAVVARAVAKGALSRSPAEHLAPQHAVYSLVARVARLAMSLDENCAALSIIHNSLVLDDIDIGPIAKRRDQGIQTVHDREAEQRIEMILWAAARSAQQGTSCCTVAARMFQRLPWAAQDSALIVHVSEEPVYTQTQPVTALSG